MVELPKDANSWNVAQALCPDRNQRITFTQTATLSAIFDSDTTVVRLFATKDCWVKFGLLNTVTAVVNDGDTQFIPAGMLIFLHTKMDKLANNYARYLSVIADSDNGTLHVLEAD